MGLARFYINDPYLPDATGEEVEALFCKMHGISHWTIHPGGEVTLVYDRHMISGDIIEAAFGGLGFDLIHVFDNPFAGGI
jgi:hypothetical protein